MDKKQLLVEIIEEFIAKYWYETDYQHIDKSLFEPNEESRLKFRKWIEENKDYISKEIDKFFNEYKQ